MGVSSLPLSDFATMYPLPPPAATRCSCASTTTPALDPVPFATHVPSTAFRRCRPAAAICLRALPCLGATPLGLAVSFLTHHFCDNNADRRSCPWGLRGMGLESCKGGLGVMDGRPRLYGSRCSALQPLRSWHLHVPRALMCTPAPSRRFPADETAGQQAGGAVRGRGTRLPARPDPTAGPHPGGQLQRPRADVHSPMHVDNMRGRVSKQTGQRRRGRA